jgi:Icc-related predicted phosphoesterase
MNVGSQCLMNKIIEIKPEIHVFGHIHESYGEFAKNGTSFYNASVVNFGYEVVNKPWVVEI